MPEKRSRRFIFRFFDRKQSSRKTSDLIRFSSTIKREENRIRTVGLSFSLVSKEIVEEKKRRTRFHVSVFQRQIFLRVSSWKCFFFFSAWKEIRKEKRNIVHLIFQFSVQLNRNNFDKKTSFLQSNRNDFLFRFFHFWRCRQTKNKNFWANRKTNKEREKERKRKSLFREFDVQLEKEFSSNFTRKSCRSKVWCLTEMNSLQMSVGSKKRKKKGNGCENLAGDKCCQSKVRRSF